MSQPRTRKYALCINNRGYRESLDRLKAYRVLPDSVGEKYGMVRVIDESGEDYLYPGAMFVMIEVPAKQPQKRKAARRLNRVAESLRTAART